MTAMADTTSNSTDTSTTTVTSTTQDVPTLPPFVGMQTMDQFGQGFMSGPGGRGHGMQHPMGGMNNIEVSSEYNATVISILEKDSDAANLISEGYSVSSIHPIVKTIVEGDGTVATKASTAIVTMTNGTTGFATINVDIANSKVTYITIVTTTVIDKSSS
jgi:hypothetical protein